MRPPDARALQETLGSLGLYSGDLDGVWGPLSQAAFDGLVEGYGRCHAAPRPKRPMGWSWDQSEGALYFDGRWVARGYSGRGEGRNNPAMEAVRGVGPIPAGRWRIGPPRTSTRTGPHIMDLTPIGHDAHGRSAFQIHGDNATGDASSGCIVLPRAYRERISGGASRVLEVTP
jgi:hypothetical protein